MSRCPFAEWRGPLPSSNYATAAQAGSPEKIGLVFHESLGSLSSADNEFKTAGIQLGSHFGLAGPGDPHFPEAHLVQWIDTDDICYAQEAGNWPPFAYLSVETGVVDGEAWTGAMIAKLGALAVWTAEDKGFPLELVDHGVPGLTTHCHYPSAQPDPAWGNHSCPGLVHVGQMPAVLAATTRPRPTPEDMMQATQLSNGDVVVPTVGAAGTPDAGHLLYWRLPAGQNPAAAGAWQCADATDSVGAHGPGNSLYLIQG